MPTIQSIYEALPERMQSAVVSLKGAQFAAERYGQSYREDKRQVRRILAGTADEHDRLQLARLKDFLRFVQRAAPYYREVLAGFDVDAMTSVDDLAALPILEKDTLRDRIEEFYTVRGAQAIEGHTGGTTGKSLVVHFTRSDFQRRMANLDVFREIHGGRHRMRRATFSGKDLVPGPDPRTFWRDNWVLNQRFYATFHMKEENLGRYVDDLNRFKPDIIDGFVSCIADICSYVRATGRTLEFRPAAIFPTSEPLFPHQRKLMREVMGVEPRDQYASSEGAPFVMECPSGRLHFWTHTGVIETHEDGDALVTSFTTHGTPLLRYRIGDRVVFAPSEARCDCGWAYPLVERIEGRAIDYILSAERGRIYSPNLSNVVKNVPNSIVKTQFVQTRPESVTVKLVVDQDRFDAMAHTEIVRQELQRRIGEEMHIDVEVVDDIPRAASGKYRLVVNKLT